MSFEEFILRVRACIGIGLATEFKIYQFIKQNKRVPNLNDLIQIMDGKYAIASDVYIQIFSKETTDLLQRTLAFSKYITIFDQAYEHFRINLSRKLLGFIFVFIVNLNIKIC